MRERRKDLSEFNIQTAANIAAGAQWNWRSRNPETIESEQAITRDIQANGAPAVSEAEQILSIQSALKDLTGGEF